jgi:DNA (cytosine-5)-methyltransferase 1
VATKRAVSLFSNCGAGDVGYRNAGFHFDVMAELDPHRLEVAILNHPGASPIPGDLRDTWPQVIEEYKAKAGGEQLDLLAACPPCQGVSSARGNRGLAADPDAGMKDKRNLLAVIIAEVARQLNPRIIVVENVPAFLTRKVRHPKTNEAVSAANLLASMLEPDYAVFVILVDLCEYGVPQTRKRTFLTFIRKDTQSLNDLILKNRAPFPIPSYAVDYGGAEPISVLAALKTFNLPSLDASSKAAATSEIANGLHSVPVWQDHRYKMVAAIPPNSGASAWENTICEHCGPVNVDISDFLCPQCQAPLLKPIVQNEDGSYRLVKGFITSSYRRMRPADPAATITTGSGQVGSHFTIHPFENRLFSALECAYLQTFPEDFKWGEALSKWGHTNVRQMIGEAVPPLFTELHGNTLASILAGELPANLISYNDPRCASARKKLNSDLLKNLSIF